MAIPVRIISALQMELTHDVKGMTTDTLNTKRDYIRKLLSTIEAQQSIEHGINANLSLSQQGRMEALKKLALNETIPALKWLRPEVTRLEEKKQRYRNQFFTVDSGMTDLAERLPTFVYLWTKLDGLDPHARMERFFHAADANEVKTLAAMLDHPEGPMIDQEVQERALLQRAERLTPRDFENYQQTQILLEFLVMARDWLAQWLEEEVGVEPSVIRTNLGEMETHRELTGA